MLLWNLWNTIDTVFMSEYVLYRFLRTDLPLIIYKNYSTLNLLTYGISVSSFRLYPGDLADCAIVSFCQLCEFFKFFEEWCFSHFPSTWKFLLNFFSFISNQSGGPGESDVSVNILTCQSHINKFFSRYLHFSESHQ